MKDKIYFGGITIIIISFIVCVISFWWVFYGIPVFTIGTILVLFSNQSRKKKIFTIITPLILYFPLTYLFLIVYNYSTPKTFLIPSNYEGKLRIIYDEECGQNVNKNDGNKILNFPSNGILILNEDFDGGFNNKYFLVDKFGEKTEMSQILDLKNLKSKLPCVLVAGSGTINYSIESNSVNIIKQKEIYFSDFYIFNKDTIYKNEFVNQKKFDSMTKKIVMECRKLNKGNR